MAESQESQRNTARALKLQLEQAEMAMRAGEESALRHIERVHSLRARLRRAEYYEARNMEPNTRPDEARSEIAPIIGLLLADVDISTADLVKRLQIALDRLDRYLVGENYIEKRIQLREDSQGAYHFTPPPDDVLPKEKGVL